MSPLGTDLPPPASTASLKPVSAELHPGPGFRVRRRICRPEPSLVQAFSAFDTPDISDQLNRLYTMEHEIRNVVNDARLFGPALTVKVFPGDNLMVHKALDLAHPGDVVVVDAGASTLNGIIGDIIATKAKHRGIAGFVIDGLVRDLPAMRAVGLPAFARGSTPVGPLHRGPGEINFSVSCGRIVVNPGDIICADGNGVVVVRQEFAADVLEQIQIKKASAATYVENVRKGRFSNAWVDQILDSSGCQIEDE